jgi:BTB/POZ domain
MFASPNLMPENGQDVMPAAPFNDARADCILRSSDGVDFRIFKIVLSLASPVFADMFNNPWPQPVSEQDRDGLQVVTVSEDSKVLDLCLRHLYPLPPPTTVTSQDAGILAEFASKYEAQMLESMAVRHLTEAIEGDPVGVYAIAVTSKRKDIAAKAARSSLRLSFSDSYLCPSCLLYPQLQSIAVEPYRELIKYHAACGDAASAVASGREWFPSWDQGRLIWTLECRNTSDLLCKTCATQDPFSRTLVEKSGFTSRRFGPWCLWNYLHRSASVLLHDPTAAAVTKQDFVLEFCNCPGCPVGVREDMLAFSRIFATEIEKAVRQVGVSI